MTFEGPFQAEVFSEPRKQPDTPTGTRERKAGKLQPICSKRAQLAELSAMTLTGGGTRLASQQCVMKTPQLLKPGG